MLVVIDTHPIQYHVPVYRYVHTHLGIPVTVIYGSDFSLYKYQDQEFEASFAWDTDLLSGYNSIFLSQTGGGGSDSEIDSLSVNGLREILQKLQPKAILLTGYSPRFYQLAFFECWQSRSALIFRAETTDHAVKRSFLKQWARDIVLRWFYSQFEQLLYVGDNSYQHLCRLGCLEKNLIFSPYCVDTSPFVINPVDQNKLRETTRQELKIGEDKIALLFVGKLSYRKGGDLLLKAIKLLPSDLRNSIVALFVGGGKMEQSLQKLTNTKPIVSAHFLGFRNQTQLSYYYYASDLFVLPSRHSETWGLVVNEALHHGIPCVVSDAVGCAPDLIVPGQTGDVFEVDSINHLAAVIKASLSLVGDSTIRGYCLDQISRYTVKCAAVGIANAYNRVVHIS